MKDTEFNIIRTNLEERILECKEYLKDIKTTDDLLNLTVNELRELKEFCKREVNDMTQICMVDFYHVIGMGNLTVQQTNIFLKLFRQYVSFRPDMKSLAKNLNNIDQLPKIPTGARFKLLKLGDVVLYSGVKDNIVEDNSTVSDYLDAKKETAKQIVENLETLEISDQVLDNNLNSITLKGNVVSLKPKDLNLFLALFGVGKDIIPTYAQSLLRKAKNKGKYIGVSWTYNDTEDFLIGIIKNVDVLEKIKKIVDLS